MGPWDTQQGCHVGIIKNNRVYALHFGGHIPKKPGYACYSLHVYQAEDYKCTDDIQVPGKRIMQRLAKKYLNSDYKSYESLVSSLSFEIKSNTTQEQKVTFLSAVALHCSEPSPS